MKQRSVRLIMDALIDTEYDDPIYVDYFRPTFCNRNVRRFFYMQIARNINCTAKRASPSDAIACVVFVDRYLRPRCLDVIRIENFATKNDDLPRNNASDSRLRKKKSDAK